MSFIKITKNSFETSLVSTFEAQFRSLELYLEKHQLSYECLDADKEIIVQVSSESEAYRLIGELNLCEIAFINDAGEQKKIFLTSVKRSGRPRNMVFDQKTGKGFTLKQYAKNARLESMSKSDIVKRGILTKAQVEAGIVSGKLAVIGGGTSTRITKVSLLKFLS